LKAKAAQEEESAAKTQVPVEVKPSGKTRRNPVVEAQLNKLDQEIADAVKQEDVYQKQIDMHQSKLEMEPVFEQQIAGVLRDYDTLRNHYNHLRERKLSADMAESLDEKQKGERYVVLDPAPAPTAPSGPNRPLILLAGLFGGLVGGIGLALALELTNDAIRSEQEAAQVLGKSVLAGIPVIHTPKQRVRNATYIIGGLLGTAALSTGVGFLIVTVTRHFS
jgi:uncharacterized protein involved in exopolysaccharide biosynthesis